MISYMQVHYQRLATAEYTGKELLSSNTNTQWHTAFYSSIPIELKDYADNLIYESEHQLGSKPLEMDVLIIKNDDGFKINKNIGLIFRRHNIVEYKSPHDYLSIDDYYKILAYAYVYKSDSAQVDQVKIEDITVSFVTSKFPRKLINHLKATYNYDIVEKDKGIYYNGILFDIIGNNRINVNPLP